MEVRSLTWDETYRAIKGGDIGVIVASLIELSIVAAVVALVWAALS